MHILSTICKWVSHKIKQRVWLVLNLETVLSFVGSTGSTTVSFILPGLFFWKLTRDDPGTSRMLNRSALGLAIYGVLVFVFW